MSATGKAVRAARGIPKYPGKEVLEAALGPLLGPASNKLAGTHVQRLLGYWVMYRVFGGRDAIVEQGIMSQASAYRNEKEFREAFGLPVSDLTIERVFGLELDEQQG